MGLLTCVLGSAGAESLTVYRCVDPSGKVALQDFPCPSSSEAEQRRYRAEQGDDSEAAAVPTPASPNARRPELPNTEPAAPPPLRWRCVDYEGKSRISEYNDPRGRYVPAWALGYSRNPAGLAGRAGRPPPVLPAQPPSGDAIDTARRDQPQIYVEDRCRPMSIAETCSYLREELGETQRQRFNQQPSGKAESDRRIEQLRDALSGC